MDRQLCRSIFKKRFSGHIKSVQKGREIMGFLNQTKLHELEELCVQEQPPACMGGCPLHVDGRSICSAVYAGDFDSALAVYKKTVPFPRILSLVCTQHCNRYCRRGEAGDSMMLRGIEEAVCRYGKEKKARSFLPKRDNTVAVVGGGLSGSTAALELAKKGCKVVIYEKEEQLGGSLLNLDIPSKVLEEEFAVLKEFPITVQCCAEITEISKLSEKYDAVYVAWGKEGKEKTETQNNIFVRRYGDDSISYDVALAMADGKHAAISIDRYLKKVSMTAGREREGVFETTLYVNMEQVQEAYGKFQPPFSKEEAQEEAGRCLDCKCLECVKECAFLQEYKTFPRKYIREVYNNLSIAMGNRHANRMINSCSLCGQCRAVCPHGLDVGEITREARQVMVKDGKMPASSFEFGLRDMEHADSEELALVRHQPGTKQSRYLFFPGCQIWASAPEIVLKTYKDLCARMQGGVGLYLGCCGIVADWAGEEMLYRERTNKLRETWDNMGRPVVIAACPSCFKVWKEQVSEAELVGIWSLLDSGDEFQSAREERRGRLNKMTVTVMDACGAREFEDIHIQVRHLLRELGYVVQPLDYEGAVSGCCGFGGLTPVSNRQLGKVMAASRVKDKSRYYITYCMNCRDRYTDAGAEAVHLLELFYGGGKEARHKPPTWSDRQRRRRWLKRTLLQDLWKEKTEGREDMALYYCDEIKEQMEERMILEEDLAETIQEAEQSGNKIIDTVKDCFIAGKRIGNVFFWVYYREKEDGYEILRAYSHRMNFR